jgi:predicted acylesterase/phospholipase RssA
MPKPKSAAELRERNRAFANATKPCDLVLKGGAASGFVYSGTIVELARTYRLQSIAGTSAGAGAAGVAAAAEYGRRSGNPEAWGYAGIEHVPEWAAERTANGWTRLKHLFGPDPKTARLYEVVSAPFTASKGRVWKALRAALSGYRGPVVAGTVIAGAIAGGILWSLAPPLLAAVGIVLLGILAALLMVLGFVGYAVWKDVSVVLPENHFGLCSAKSEPSDAPDAPPDRMTGWLYGLYQRLAGKPMDDPLTFGDLWGAPRHRDERGIALSLMSVNLSLGRPVRITHDDEHHTLEEDEAYWFDPADFKRLFPRDVVIAMEKAAGAVPDGGETSRRLPFPPIARVPVIVGVRMSFALPVLFSAVRLYKRDASRLPVEQRAGKPLPESVLEPCWFADGGVCTSLPIHLFDKPMPRWPTFAVNLRHLHPDAVGKDSAPLRVWMDHDFATGPAFGWLREWWKRIDVDAVPRDPTRFGKVAPGTQLERLLGAMLSTAIGWVDGAHLRLATCRDRVAHVCLDPAEGAFNVDTDSAAIRRLAEYGKDAGRKLVGRFAEIDAAGWTEHRAIRYIAAMQLAARFIDDFETGFRSGRTAAAGERAIEGALATGGFIAPPAAYGLTEEQLERMAQLTQALLDEEAHVPEPGKPGWPDHPALKPKFVMRVMPDA